MDTSDFREGQRVSGNWKGRGRWYNGRVGKISHNKIYVLYDDGDKEWISESHQIKIVEDNHDITHFSNHDRVFGQWQGKSVWYPGKVHEIKGYSVYVQYDDGDKEWINDLARLIKSLEITHINQLCSGDIVVAEWAKDKKFYRGKIGEIAGNQVFIHFDDGDTQWMTDLSKIKKDVTVPSSDKRYGEYFNVKKVPEIKLAQEESDVRIQAKEYIKNLTKIYEEITFDKILQKVKITPEMLDDLIEEMILNGDINAQISTNTIKFIKDKEGLPPGEVKEQSLEETIFELAKKEGYIDMKFLSLKTNSHEDNIVRVLYRLIAQDLIDGELEGSRFKIIGEITRTKIDALLISLK